MSAFATAAISIGLLLAVLAFAVARPRGLPEAVLAVPAAAVAILAGAIPMDDAVSEMVRLAPVVGFLAAILILAQLCDDEGLFEAAGRALARTNQPKDCCWVYSA